MAAFDRYTELYSDHLADDEYVEKECLGISHQVLCAYYFPFCKDNDEPERGVCDFLCDAWGERCPDDDWQNICEDSESS